MTAGRHVLELTSAKAGVESVRSAPMTVTRLTSLEVTDATRIDAGTDAGSAGLAAVSEAIAEMGVVSAMAATPDGRVLAIEDEARIRVVQNDSVIAAPALAIDRGQARLAGIAVDTAFETTRSVFVAWVSGESMRAPELHITRYYEFRNALREGATIVTGLPVSGGGVVPLAVDADGLLYVAVPGRAQPGDADTPYGASILRFTRDGFVPRSNLRASPIVADGYVRPSALAVDAIHRRLWLSGSHPEWAHSVASVAIDPGASARWPAQPVGTAVPEPGETIVALTGGGAHTRVTLIAAAQRQLHRAVLGDDGRAQAFEAIARLDLEHPVVAPSSDADGLLYVAGTNESGKGIILRLSTGAAER